MKKRYFGAMFGLAIGDALGAPVEFLQRDTFAGTWLLSRWQEISSWKK